MTPDASSSQTPGQVAYSVYWRVDAWTFDTPWDHLTPMQQAAWEAVAQAVLALKTDEVHTATVVTLHALNAYDGRTRRHDA